MSKRSPKVEIVRTDTEIRFRVGTMVGTYDIRGWGANDINALCYEIRHSWPDRLKIARANARRKDDA